MGSEAAELTGGCLCCMLVLIYLTPLIDVLPISTGNPAINGPAGLATDKVTTNFHRSRPDQRAPGDFAPPAIEKTVSQGISLPEEIIPYMRQKILQMTRLPLLEADSGAKRVNLCSATGSLKKPKKC